MPKKTVHYEQSGRHRTASRVKVYLIAVVILIVFLPSFIKYQELSYKGRKLEARIAELTAENRQLAEEKMRLETDITYIEKRAREAIGVARKGEIVLKNTSSKK